jgi:Flp pilus assembly protein protease CpaA
MDLIILSIGITLLLSIIAGLWDLLTTEVPDEIPLLIAAAGLAIIYFSGDFTALFYSLVIGTVLLITGFLLYKKGQWGGADAFMMAAIGYSIPLMNGEVFMLSFLPNLLLVGTAYVIVYALALGIKYPFVFSQYAKDLRHNWKFIIGLPAAFAIFIGALAWLSAGYATFDILPLVKIIGLVVFVTFFWRYGRVIEKKVFRREVLAKDLKAGDVLEDSIWKGLTEEDLKRLRKTDKKYVVKEGVRFVPAFPLALAATLLFGNIMFIII